MVENVNSLSNIWSFNNPHAPQSKENVMVKFAYTWIYLFIFGAILT